MMAFSLIGFIILMATIQWPVYCLSLNDDQEQLLLIQLVFRHGDRTPIRLYHSDPYQIQDFKEGLGELTNYGKRRMFNLGQKLRQHYDHYLRSMAVKNIHARSSSRKRCMESCALLLAVMFPPKKNSDEIWNNNAEIGSIWQPISIQTVESSRD